MKAIMKKAHYSTGYNPDNFPNPGAFYILSLDLDLYTAGIQYHYDCLQAIAFNEEPPEVDDRTVGSQPLPPTSSY